ncbi:MAG: FecR domain-containing protein [Rhodothermia bacterium]|nr:FecR domain-containing protein [Rhodothermia bacterium]
MTPHDTNSPDRIMLDDWIQAHPAPIAKDLQMLWDLSETHPLSLSHPDLSKMEASWDLLEDRTTHNIHSILPRYRYWVFGVAAAIALLLGVTLFWQIPSPIAEPTRILAQNAEQKTIQLPDGSEVSLNSGTVLDIAGDFDETTRTLQLNGEGFFSVKKSDKPFIIQTFNAQIKVMGTKFNVRARPEDLVPTTTVYLKEGKVAFSSLNGSKEVVLAPGQSSRMAAQQLETPKADRQDEALAWQQYRFSFTNEPIGHIIDELSRRFNIPIHADVVIQQKRHTLLLGRRTEVESVLNDLCNSAGLRFRPTKDGYELIAK